MFFLFFFCLCHNRIEKFRRPGNFFPSGKKISWSALASAWEDFLLFLGGWGARRLMQVSTYHAVSICVCY